MLGAAGRHEVEGHMGRTTDVFMRETSTRAFVTFTHHTLTDKISAPNHKDEQNDGDDWTNGGGTGRELCSLKKHRKTFSRRTFKTTKELIKKEIMCDACL